MGLFRAYHYGPYKWDNYLLDIQDEVNASKGVQRRSLQVQKDALEVAEGQRDALRQQTAELSRIGETLQTGLEEMRAEFQWGFTLIVDRMDQQVKLLSQITEQLDAIHKTLRSPLMTQARELFDLGQERFRKGLLDKALEAFLQSELKNEVYFPLQLQMGKLLLYGRDVDDNVVDLAQAEKHLSLAARYAQAEKETLSGWSRPCGEAHFHAAVAAYLIGQQNQQAGNLGAMRECLERALEHLDKAVSLWPQFTDSIYSQAKCYVLLGKKQEALQKVEILSDKDRRYYAKGMGDKDFDLVRKEFEEVFRQSVASPGPLTRATEARLREAAEALSWVKRSAPEADRDLTRVGSCERYLAGAQKKLQGFDVDIETLSPKLAHFRDELAEIAERVMRDKIDSLQGIVRSFEYEKGSREGLAQSRKLQMLKTGGTAQAGFLLGFVFCLVWGVFLAMIFSSSSLSAVVKHKDFNVAAFYSMSFPMGIGFLLGMYISRRSRIRSRQREIDVALREIEDWNRVNSPLIQKARGEANGWKEQLDRFLTWRAQNPLPAVAAASDANVRH